MPESLFLRFILTYQLPLFSRNYVCLSRSLPSYYNVSSLLMSCGCRYDLPPVPAHKVSCRSTAAGLPPWDRVISANGRMKLSRKRIATVIFFGQPAFDFFSPPSLSLLFLGYMQNSWASSPPLVLFFRNRCRQHTQLLLSCHTIAFLSSCSFEFLLTSLSSAVTSALLKSANTSFAFMWSTSWVEDIASGRWVNYYC